MAQTITTIDVLIIAYQERRITDAVIPWLAFDFVKRVVVVLGAVRGVEPLGLPPTDPETMRALDAIDDERVHVIKRSTYWADKNEMTIKGTAACLSDIVWHVDADEYYLPTDIVAAREVLANDNWSLAAMPHLVYWRDFNHVLALNGNDDWFCPARVWRRKEGEVFMHLPFATIRRADGREQSVGVRRLKGRCHHAAWVDDARVRFRLAYYRARGTLPNASEWLRRVWVGGETPVSGVHPALPGLFPVKRHLIKPTILST